METEEEGATIGPRYFFSKVYLPTGVQCISTKSSEIDLDLLPSTQHNIIDNTLYTYTVIDSYTCIYELQIARDPDENIEQATLKVDIQKYDIRNFKSLASGVLVFKAILIAQSIFVGLY